MSTFITKLSVFITKHWILFFIFITITSFIAGLISVAILWLILRTVGVATDFWSMLSSISTALAASAVFGTVVVAYIQLSEVYNSRYIDVANKLFDELNSSENIEARRWIFQKLPDDPVEGMKTLPQEGREAIKKVLNSLDHVAFLTQAGWVPESLIMPWMHPMIAKSWFKLKPYVEYERERRKEPYYYAYASQIAQQCIEWRKKNNIVDAEKIIWNNDSL